MLNYSVEVSIISQCLSNVGREHCGEHHKNFNLGQPHCLKVSIFNSVCYFAPQR